MIKLCITIDHRASTLILQVPKLFVLNLLARTVVSLQSNNHTCHSPLLLSPISEMANASPVIIIMRNIVCTLCMHSTCKCSLYYATILCLLYYEWSTLYLHEFNQSQTLGYDIPSQKILYKKQSLRCLALRTRVVGIILQNCHFYKLSLRLIELKNRIANVDSVIITFIWIQ